MIQTTSLLNCTYQSNIKQNQADKEMSLHCTLFPPSQTHCKPKNTGDPLTFSLSSQVLLNWLENSGTKAML